jgi:thiol-disulfide isomerase/thioredoxin
MPYADRPLSSLRAVKYQTFDDDVCMPLFLKTIAVVAIVGLTTAVSAVRAADLPAAEPATAVLHLRDGSFAAGNLDDSARSGVLRWQASAFVSPFEFPLDRVNAVHWPPPQQVPKPTGDYCFELAGGDILFGTLISLDQKQAEISIPRLGRLRVDRASIQRIYRWRNSADLVYLGPNGMAGWHETPPSPGGRPAAATRVGWREESGQIVTDREGSSIQGDFQIADKAVIEFEISWKVKPDFVFALGIDDNDMSTVKRAFRFEVWVGSLVIQRELENEADLAVIQEINPGPGRVHLQVYLDQGAGRIWVCSQSGKQLASLRPIKSKGVYSGLYLANLRGDLRLEWLRIGRWTGELPREVDVAQSRIHRADGTIVYGQVAKLDAATREFVVTAPSGETRIAEEKIAGIFLPVTGDDRARPVRAVYDDGTRLSGQLDKVEKGALVVNVPGIAGSPRLPVAGLRSLVMTNDQPVRPLPKSDTSGRLELSGLRLPGQLVDGSAHDASSCVVWQPLASDLAAALKPDVSGRIIFKEPLPPEVQRPPIQNLNGRIMVAPQPAPVLGVAGVVGRFMTAMAEPDAEPPASSQERRALYLRDGDVIPSTITRIDEEGVWFKTSLSSSTFVAHAKVKAVELAPDAPSSADAIRLTKAKKERLLTLPRMQKADPPAHLIRSKNGDYLRGRVAKMDAKMLEIEIRADSKQVPRERVSRIIWLHPDELDGSSKRAVTSDRHSTRVQALRNDGVRLTFQADRFAGTTLSGTSDVLGKCQVAVTQVDQLLIGAAIDQAAALLTYAQWKLKNAPEPKFVTAGDAGDGAGGNAGTESPLVGKPAPDFTLDLVDGKPFHLAESKGKDVVILDFWATWCGPCLQAMPQVERAAAAFKDQNVRLVAVNLQETAAQKLNVTVALDRDGGVADKYGAVAIPQTVIIGRDGQVARLFVGGGAHLEEQLKAAIKAVLEGDKPVEPKKKP